MFVKMEVEDYFASTAYSRSILHAVLKSPKLARHLRDTPCKSSRSLRKGSALHCAVLEPNTFSQRYCVIEGNRNATRVKEAIAEAELNGFTVLKDAEMDSTMRMCEAIVSHPKAGKLVSEGIIEQAAFWDDPDTGLPCKCRLDLFRAQDGIIIDLKTSADFYPRKFAQSAYEYGYHLQAAMYLDGARASGVDPSVFGFIVVQNEPPYDVVVYCADNTFVDLGRRQYKKALQIAKQCEESGRWPGFSDEIETLELPIWARREHGYE